MEQRILLLALRGRDAPVIADLFAKQGHASHICYSPAALAAALAEGAALAVVTEESLTGADCTPLTAWIRNQESWSDFPIILLATKRLGNRPEEAQRTLEGLGNVVVLERPIHSQTLASAVNSALRGRRRQYEARSRLVELQAAEERLRQLNGTLETRIADRTTALSRANNQLMQEVAEREKAQAALVQVQKMEAVGQLTGGIAHDFNNLLTVISGNLELIERRAGEPRIVTYAGLARHAAERAAKLTHQLLAFSRRQQLSLAPTSLNALVDGMNDLLERTIGPQIRKVIRLDPAAPWVTADANQLELAVLNLAINARDAMTANGTLTIETAVSEPVANGLAEGRYGIVRVSDTGTGIPDALLDKVFDPFFTTKPLGKGTGLGLSQVFGIARQSGGTAQVEHTGKRGTTVAIWLPLTLRPAADAYTAVSAPKAGDAAPGSVLVIDDDDGVRRFIVECMEMLGYRVTEAASGAAGLEHLTAEVPDLMIVDFAMAGMTGIDVAEQARFIAPALPIILATGYAETGGVEEAEAIRTVLRKPFHIDELAHAVHAALAV